MATRGFNPFRLDVRAFAKDASQLEGSWPLASLPRMVESSAFSGPPDDGIRVQWSARGERRPLRGNEVQTLLHLQARTCVALECQRCLEPVETEVAVERSFLFVAGEDAAAQLDADSEVDVLDIGRALDLRELVEDELLLALPLVPHHEACPEPLPLSAGDVLEEAEDNPFTALQSLKRTAPLN